MVWQVLLIDYLGMIRSPGSDRGQVHQHVLLHTTSDCQAVVAVVSTFLYWLSLSTS